MCINVAQSAVHRFRLCIVLILGGVIVIITVAIPFFLISSGLIRSIILLTIIVLDRFILGVAALSIPICFVKLTVLGILAIVRVRFNNGVAVSRLVVIALT